MSALQVMFVGVVVIFSGFFALGVLDTRFPRILAAFTVLIGWAFVIFALVSTI